MASLLKWIGDTAGGIERQLNPFDGGKTFNNKVGNAPIAPQQRAAIPQINQATGFNQPMRLPQTPTTYGNPFTGTLGAIGNAPVIKQTVTPVISNAIDNYKNATMARYTLPQAQKDNTAQNDSLDAYQQQLDHQRNQGRINQAQYKKQADYIQSQRQGLSTDLQNTTAQAPTTTKAATDIGLLGANLLAAGYGGSKGVTVSPAVNIAATRAGITAAQLAAKQTTKSVLPQVLSGNAVKGVGGAMLRGGTVNAGFGGAMSGMDAAGQGGTPLDIAKATGAGLVSGYGSGAVLGVGGHVISKGLPRIPDKNLDPNIAKGVQAVKNSPANNQRGDLNLGANLGGEAPKEVPITHEERLAKNNLTQNEYAALHNNLTSLQEIATQKQRDAFNILDNAPKTPDGKLTLSGQTKAKRAADEWGIAQDNHLKALNKVRAIDGESLIGMEAPKVPSQPKNLEEAFSDPKYADLFNDAPVAKQAHNAFQDITKATPRNESTKEILKRGGSPVYHDTTSKGVEGILNSGEIKPNQAPFSQIAGQGVRVSTTRNFDNYSRYHNSPYRFTIDETKLQQKGIPDNKDEFETIFKKGIPTNKLESLAIDTTNPALLDDIKSGKVKQIIDLAKSKGIKVEFIEGKKLPNEGANAEIQALTKKAFEDKVPSQPKTDSQYLYHGTNETVLDSIKQDGLKPMRRGVLSLSKDEPYAKSYAHSGMTPTGTTSPVMLRVNKELLNGKTVEGSKTRPLPDQLHEILTKNAVPPQALEIQVNGKWKPLVEKPTDTPLTQEARKYKSADEFAMAKLGEKYGFRDRSDLNRRMDTEQAKYSNLKNRLRRTKNENTKATLRKELDDLLEFQKSDMPIDEMGNTKSFTRQELELTDIYNQAHTKPNILKDESGKLNLGAELGKPKLPEPPKATGIPKPEVSKAIDAQGNQLLLNAPKEKPSIEQQVADMGAVSPQKAKQIFKRTGIAPEVLQKTKGSQVPIVATAEGLVAKNGNTANRKALQEIAHNLDIYKLGGKDMKPFSLAREIPDRILEGVFGKNADKVKEFLTSPIRKNEANRLDWLTNTNTTFEKIFKDANIKRDSNADKLAFKYGEKKLTAEQVIEADPKNGQKIIHAADAARDFYDKTLDKINTSLRHYGYAEIQKRSDYITHTQELGSVIDQLGNLLNSDKNKLPTNMSGVNMDTKPGKQFFKYSLERTGDKSQQSLVHAIENYAHGASQQIFHTDSVQRTRALQEALANPRLRVDDKTPIGTLLKSSDRGNVGVLQKLNPDGTAEVHFTNTKEGTQKTVTIPREQLQVAKDPGKGDSLSNFNSWLSDYASHLAGKNSPIDRGVEKIFGRQVLAVGQALKARTGANMIGGNLSSALTNFIPLTQSLATTSKPAAIRGMFEAIRTPFNDRPGMIDGVQSQFLKNRFAKTDIKASNLDNVKEAASWVFGAVDRYTAETVTRGKYYELISKGLDPQTAMTKADDFARKTIADRSIGETPSLFNSKTLGFITQFQLEVNNQLSVLTKDIPAGSKSKTEITSKIAQVVLYSYLANTLYEHVTGRRPAIDPIEYGLNFKANLEKATKAAPNKQGIGYAKAVGGLGTDIISGLPFGGITDPFTGKSSGRLPFTTGVPDPTKIASNPIGELTKPITTYALPFGGNQLKKTLEGADALIKGKVTDAAGKTKFPVDQNAVNAVKLLAFGKYADPHGVEYLAGKGINPAEAKPTTNTASAATSKSSTPTGNLNLQQIADANKTGKKDGTKLTANDYLTPDEQNFLKLDSSQQQAYLKANPKDAYLANAKLGKQVADHLANPDWLPSGVDATTASQIKPDELKILKRYEAATTKGKDIFNNGGANRLALIKAQYSRDKANGSIGSAEEDYKRTNEVNKAGITTNYSPEVNALYGMGKAQLIDFFNKNPNKSNLFAQVQELDQKLRDNGFTSSAKFKYGLASGKGRGGRRGSGRVKIAKFTAPKAPKLTAMRVKAPRLVKAKLPKTRTKLA